MLILPQDIRKFKSKKDKNKYKKIKENIFEITKLRIKNKLDSLTIQLSIKKLFHVIPITAKQSRKPEIVELRNFVIYLLVHYSKEQLLDISTKFNISIDNLKHIKNNDNLHKKYEANSRIFFKQFEGRILYSEYQSLTEFVAFKKDSKDEV